MKCILRGALSFSGSDWKSISEDAKNLIRSMLQPNAEDRPTAEQVLGEWGGQSQLKARVYSGVATDSS